MGRKKCLQLWIIFALVLTGAITALPVLGQRPIDMNRLKESIEKTRRFRTSADARQIENLTSDLNITNDRTTELLISGPYNFNPDLEQPSLVLPNHLISPDVSADELREPLDSGEPTDLKKIDNPNSLPVEHSALLIEWDDLEVDLSNSVSNSSQSNRLITPTFRGHLVNGNTVTFSPGFNQFFLRNVDPVLHVPLTVGWEGAIDSVDLTVGGGLDIYNRLPIGTHFNAKASLPLWTGATVSMSFDQSPYLFNAQTLENGISVWRYGPDLFWQIDPKTTLFSLVRIGNFSDGNFEQQSFSRLEREVFGNSAIAANLFNWSFQQNLEVTSGYFSPPDFLVASLELSWETEIAENINCRVAGSVGQQRLNSSWVVGYGHQALCSFEVIPGMDFDFGYNFSSVGNGQSVVLGESAYSDFQMLGSVRTQF